MDDFRILGPLAVLRDGHPLEIQGAKERATLAILLVHAGQIVSADYLIDALWAEEPPATARKSLHVRIAALRKVLGAERIVSRGPGYLIHIEPGGLDLDRFERLVAQGGDELREALAIWSGPPLVDFQGEWWAQVAAAR
ncbi:MAG TPA: winged helix-turn-helix domain-containing protein, partial [Gaiellales bacterium]|nr:winged helix-turn-helix domain-containing protein [Gaiellales bacterium]